MSVRSAPLAKFFSTVSATVTLFTVPDGETWLVKSIIVNNTGVNPRSVQIALFPSGGAWGAQFVNEAMAGPSILQWDGWLALGPGDLLKAAINGDSVAVWVSGSALLGTV